MHIDRPTAASPTLQPPETVGLREIDAWHGACSFCSGSPFAPSDQMLTKASLIGLLMIASACSRSDIASFSELDRDDDGRISESEAGRDSRFGRLFQELDVDRDGELTPREYLAGAGGSEGGGKIR